MNKYSFKTFLIEMAKPTEAHLAKVYYHGTSERSGLEILKHGIQPGDLVMPEKFLSSRQPNLNPRLGKVYITPDLKYAQIYAIGGDIAGSTYKSREAFGYLFVIDGQELSDIEPDEDSIGELLWAQLVKPDPENKFLARWLVISREHLTPHQWKEFKEGEFVMQAHLGKKLLKFMPDSDKLAFINLGAHIANTGKLWYKEAWKVDLTKIKDLKKDASNFFEVAERIN